MTKKYLSKDCSLAALLSVLLVVGFAIVIPQIHVLNEMVLGYYNTLPVSESADFDRDEIPNTIDDSDGDHISDKYDSTPFGTLHGSLIQR
ncbi:hypothetical protein COU76_05320 [Candidatus Peregrinibacteria bacterium CG10_big_fil_rev_8_21_14_0_10_49_10]|nr:MAG: hypothetical protein COU76_05320 [Candidatus Peregrinibacteria bacterium CG10_big_fil_rev_8_21_14_0_10_49_10]